MSEDVRWEWAGGLFALDWYKRKPLSKCPNCGEYKYTKYRSPLYGRVRDLPTWRNAWHYVWNLLTFPLPPHPGRFNRSHPEVGKIGYKVTHYCTNCERREETTKELFDEFRNTSGDER